MRFRARAFPVGVPALVASILRSVRSGVLFRGFIPPRSGACSSQATASLPLARLRSPTFAGCHGALPRLRGFVPRGDRSAFPGVTRLAALLPLLRFPPLGSPPSVPGCPGPPMTLSRRPSQALTVRDRLRRFAVTGVGSPSPVCRPTRGSKPCTALRWCLGLLRVSTGGAETVPPDAFDYSRAPRRSKPRIRDQKPG
jgi:hypothetical protein